MTGPRVVLGLLKMLKTKGTTKPVFVGSESFFYHPVEFELQAGFYQSRKSCFSHSERPWGVFRRGSLRRSFWKLSSESRSPQHDLPERSPVLPGARVTTGSRLRPDLLPFFGFWRRLFESSRGVETSGIQRGERTPRLKALSEHRRLSV